MTDLDNIDEACGFHVGLHCVGYEKVSPLVPELFYRLCPLHEGAVRGQSIVVAPWLDLDLNMLYIASWAEISAHTSTSVTQSYAA